MTSGSREGVDVVPQNKELQLTGILRWVGDSRHSGILQLGDREDPAELVFVDGGLLLPRAYPPSRSLAAALEGSGENGPARLREAVQNLVEDVTTRKVGTFRFRRRPSRDDDVGPIDPLLLSMELAVHRRSEDDLLNRLGGETARLRAVAGCTVPQSLAPVEAKLLERLEEAHPVNELCSGPTRRGQLEALCRLSVAGLLEVEENPPASPQDEAGDPETLQKAKEPAKAPVEVVDRVEAVDMPREFAHPSPHPAVLAIWRDQFHLTGDPFALTPDPAFLYLSEVHAEALAGLKLGIWERRGLLVMTGEVGTGKTTLAYSLLSQLDSQVETAYLSNTLLSFEEILVSALRDFGVPCERRKRLDLIEALNSFLRRAATEGRIVALVIDEAQNLSHEAFEGLRLLLNFETYKTKLLQIVLVGQPELASRLAQPGLRQVRDRVAVNCRLDPLSRNETRRYIEHRLGMVGGSSEIFTRPALGLLVRKSRGIPRRINILCHNSMLFAYGKDLERVNRSIVSQAVRDVDGNSLF